MSPNMDRVDPPANNLYRSRKYTMARIVVGFGMFAFAAILALTGTLVAMHRVPDAALTEVWSSALWFAVAVWLGSAGIGGAGYGIVNVIQKWAPK